MTADKTKDDTLNTMIAAELALGKAEQKYLEAVALMKVIEGLRQKLAGPGWDTNRILAAIRKAAPMIAKLGGAGGIAGIATALAADEGAFSGLLSKVFGLFG